MKKINIAAVRADFPVLSSQMKGHPLAYFDNGATGLTPLPVINAIENYYRNSSCNIHRGIHAGDEIVITEMEHHANLVPWQQLAARKSAYLKFIPIDPKTGCLQLDKLEQILTPKTKLLAVSGMSNVTGVENPLPRLVEAARAVDALVLIDAAQYVVHADVDVQKLDVDFLVFSGHKLYGPTGIGVLYGKQEVLESMYPFISGGDMILDVKKEHSTFRKPPYRLEAGTPNIAGALGLSAAITYINGIGMSAIQDREKTLMKYALQRAEGIDGMHVYGPF